MRVPTPSNDDIAYVRQLAESGARAPLTGGRFMVWWGLLLTVAYVAHSFAITTALGRNGAVFGIIWVGFGLVGTLGQVILARSMGAMPGGGSAGNLAARTVWGAGAFAIVAMTLGAAVAAQTGAGPSAFDGIAPVAFAVYACALIVTGSLAGDRMIRMAGFGAVLMVGVFTALIAHPDRYLIAAAGVALTVLLPGILLVAREPRR